MKTILRSLVAAFLVVLSLSIGDAEAQETPQPAANGEGSVGEDLGYGVGSVVANVFYMPAKLTYAGLGLLTGGLGYVISAGNMDVANNIMNPAIRGNYVVTPRHLTGEEPLIFVGPSQPDPAAPPQR